MNTDKSYQGYVTNVPLLHIKVYSFTKWITILTQNFFSHVFLYMF